MKIQGLKNINITAISSTEINHLLISQEKIVELFNSANKINDLSNFINAPGLKVIIFPNQKKDIAFEQFRFIVSDKSEVDVTVSPLPLDFKKVLDSNLVDLSKIIAYGFNYDVLVEIDKSKLSDIIGPKLLSLPNIQNGGVKVSYIKDSLPSILGIEPFGKDNLFIVHLNVQFNSNTIPSIETLKADIITQFRELESIIKTI